MYPYKLSIVIPSHYAEPHNYASISAAIDVAKTYKNDVQIVISDNSQNEDKKYILQKISNGLDNVLIVDGPLEGNYFFAFTKTQGEFVFVMADDDRIISSGVRDILDVIKNNMSNCDVILAPFGVDSENGLSTQRYVNVDGDDKLFRFSEIMKDKYRLNFIFFSVIKRELLQKAYDFWIQMPNPQGYHDLIFDLNILLNADKIKMLSNVYFIYNMHNWSNSQSAFKSRLNYIKRNNYPLSILVFQPLIQIVEGIGLIQKMVSDKNAVNKYIEIWFLLYYGDFIHGVREIETNGHYREMIDNCPQYNFIYGLAKKYSSMESINLAELFDDVCFLYNHLNGSGSKFKEFWLS